MLILKVNKLSAAAYQSYGPTVWVLFFVTVKA